MNKRRSLGLAFTYVGSVVGAGFSSGREIWRFFARHQIYGIYAIGIVIIFFTILAPIFFKLGKDCEIESYQDFFYKYVPKPFSYLFDLIYSCFLLGSVSVMLAGAGAVFHNMLGMSYIFGVMLTISFVLLTLILNREGIMAVNSILIPALILITIYTILSYLTQLGFSPRHEIIVNAGEQLQHSYNWLIDALLYGSYNLVISIAVMTNILYKEDEDNIIVAGITGGIILSVLLIIIFVGLITTFQITPQEEIPLLHITEKLGKGVYLAYIIALYFAMVTTAIANYYAFTKRFISLFNIKYEVGLVIGLLFMLPLIPSGFSGLIDKLYPLFGCLGLFMIIFYTVILVRRKSIR